MIQMHLNFPLPVSLLHTLMLSTIQFSLLLERKKKQEIKSSYLFCLLSLTRLALAGPQHAVLELAVILLPLFPCARITGMFDKVYPSFVCTEEYLNFVDTINVP